MSASLPSRFYHTKRFRTSDTWAGGSREKPLLFSENIAFLVFLPMGSLNLRRLAPQTLRKL
uniref:Uncharacterized protein n=1 Tax=Acetithermum autotrophicum TaxID=1446466 RepID=H5SQW9_ACEAU|nr:hypothetical protein HGMM_OP2C036 [Candidatus Acetothermum autotrophicum]